MRLNMANLSNPSSTMVGQRGTGGTIHHDGALRCPTFAQNPGDAGGQVQTATIHYSPASPLSPCDENPVGHSKALLDQPVPPVPLVPPKKHIDNDVCTDSTEPNIIAPEPEVESIDHDCMNCLHWQGMQVSVNGQGKLKIFGGCDQGYRPWRLSNIASHPTYYHWHFVGKCLGPNRA